MQPETRYARLGDLHLAYQVLGESPPDLLLLDQWFGNVVPNWAMHAGGSCSVSTMTWRGARSSDLADVP